MLVRIIIAYLFCFRVLAMEHQENYLTFIDTLVGGISGHINVEISQTEIKVSGPTNNILELKNKLFESMSSSENLARNLHYENNGEKKEFPRSSLAMESVSDGKAIIKNLLSSMIKDLCLDVDQLFNEEQGAKITNGRLCSRLLPSRCLRAYKSQCANLIDCFRGHSNEQIRDALDQQLELSPLEEGMDNENCVKDFIYLSPVDKQHHCMNVDLQAIYDKTHSFAYSITNKDNQTSTLIIDKVSLFSRIQALVNGDALLRLIQCEEKTIAFPMILPRENKADKRPTLHFFVIDTSSSISEQDMQVLKAKLKSVIRYIATENPDAQAQLVSFNSETQFGKHYSIKDNGLEKEIMALHSHGATRLYGTMFDLASHIRTKKLVQDYAIAITLFTDGSDNTSFSHTARDVEDNYTDLSQHINSITIGLGSVDSRLGTFAQSTGGHYYAIHEISDLELLLEQRLLLGRKQNFLSILISLEEELREITKVVQDQEEISMPPIAIQVESNAEIIIGQQKFANFDLSGAAPMTPSDHASLMKARVLDIANDNTKTIAARIEELGNLKKEVQHYFASHSVPMPIRRAAEVNIDEYLKALTDSKGSKINLQSAINTLSGIRR